MEKETLSLPPGWKRLHSNNGVYFWHKEANRVQWKFPKEEAEAYEKLKQTHGYVNIQRDAASCNEDSDSYDVIQHGKLVNIQPSADSTPVVDTSTTPHQPREYNLSDHDDIPPPLPARNYDEEDYLNSNTSTYPLSQEDTPPPIPERTDLSRELLSPNSVQMFLYSSLDSDINKIPVKSSTLETPLQAKQDPMYDEIIDVTRNGLKGKSVKKGLSPAPPTKAEFMISANPSPDDTAKCEPIADSSLSKFVTKEKVSIPKTDENMYDEIPSNTCRGLAVVRHQVSPPKSSDSSINSSGLENIDSIAKRPPIDPPPPNHPPPQPPIPSNSSNSGHVPAYEVVPLTVTSNVDSNGLMTVDRNEQRERLKHQQSLPYNQHKFNMPPLLPRKLSVSERGSSDVKKSNTFGHSSRLMQSLIDSDQEYDRLVHDRNRRGGSASVTLPRKFEEAGYSKLSSDAQLMRSGVTIKGSLMSSSNSSLLQDSADNSQNDESLPLIHAPNAPTVLIRPRLHTYEDLSIEVGSGLADDEPSLVDEDIAPPDNKAKPNSRSPTKSPSKPIVKTHNLSPSIMKPESVTDEDFERRLERLDNHFYPEVDIPAWSGAGDPVLSPRRPSEIKKTLRKSWNIGTGNTDDGLPAGWAREVNEQGQVFYWHLPTGNIQYTKPEGNEIGSSDGSVSPLSPKPTTFAAEYIGTVEVAEDKLVKGKSVQVVFNTIKMLHSQTESLSCVQFVSPLKRNDKLHLQIQGLDLKWLNAIDGSVILTQSINKIRVWGVGQDNDRDFGYVSRNPVTQRHQCHIFRCDIAAVGLIQCMLDNHEAHKKLIKKIDESPSSNESTSVIPQGSVLVNVPVDSVQRQRSVSQKQVETEMKSKENYKRLEATFIGSRFVTAPNGINVVNESVIQLSLDKSRWLPVYVDVATSHIRILDKKSEMVLKEHRIRFLSFLGIAQDDKYCGYVVDNGDNQFQFHGFFCHPNSDKLCLALHSACQSRYQRVIDARLSDSENVDVTANSNKKPSLLKRIGSWKSAKSKDQEEESVKPTSQNFVVQFLGCEVVSKPKGVDVITDPLQKLAKKTSGIHLVELVVSSSGFTINDPQKKQFASKHIATKKVTYCVRVRSHFVFIAKEGSKHICYMFNESEVAAASIVTAIQDLMS